MPGCIQGTWKLVQIGILEILFRYGCCSFRTFKSVSHYFIHNEEFLKGTENYATFIGIRGRVVEVFHFLVCWRCIKGLFVVPYFLKMTPTPCPPETSLADYPLSLRKTPQYRRRKLTTTFNELFHR